jgi:hypothetical protein
MLAGGLQIIELFDPPFFFELDLGLLDDLLVDRESATLDMI